MLYALSVPFFSPFKDEYHRQRMLQHIQRGMSQFHEREMQFLTTGSPTIQPYFYISKNEENDEDDGDVEVLKINVKCDDAF